MTTCRNPAIFSLLGSLLLAATACTYASADGSEPSAAAPDLPPELIAEAARAATAHVQFEGTFERGSVPLANGVLRQAVASTQGEAEFPPSLYREGASVRVEILNSLSSEDIADLVTSLGGQVYGEVPGVLAEGFVPLDSLVELEAHLGVEYLRPPLAIGIEPKQPVGVEMTEPESFTGFLGQEVAKTNADDWQAMGYAGEGVRVGIIDSFEADFWNAAQAAGEVPAPSGMFCQLFGNPCNVFDIFGSPHGTAVAEIIHEQAPDAQIYIASAYTVSDLQAVVNYFASQGVDIISRSQTAEYDGPGDGTGPIASVMDNAVV